MAKVGSKVSNWPFLNVQTMSVERHPYPSAPPHAPLLRMLLALDGSTTRVCEALAAGPVDLLLLNQSQTAQVPASVQHHLGGKAWLVRTTSLHAHGQVLMDNLSYTRLDAVPDWFLAALQQGQAPIGHLLGRLFVRRLKVSTDPLVAKSLWQHVGDPDLEASRSYTITTPEGPLMLIFETFRAGIAGCP
jgi:chorismate-pyruvate lyase